MNKPIVWGVLYLCFIIGITACETAGTEMQPQNENDEIRLQPKEVGKYHNIALDEIMNSGQLRALRSDYSALRKAVVKRMAEINPRYFEHTQLLEEAGTMQQSLVESGLLKVVRIHSDTHADRSESVVSELNFKYYELFDHLREEGVVSNKLHSAISDVYRQYAGTGISADQYQKIEQQLEEVTETDQEGDVDDSFLETLSASDQYWSTDGKGKQARMMNLCSQGVIWADAGGALYGMLGGPVWSVIEGALFSSIAQMNCDSM